MTKEPHLLRTVGFASGLPEPPTSEMAPYLDAAARCIERYGWSKTNAKDIASEAGVDRTTVYRHLGTKDDILRLLVAREVHGLISNAIAVSMGSERGPQVIVEILAYSIEYIWNHAAISKLLKDDREALARFLADGFGDTIERFSDALAPLMGAAMETGAIASRDPVIMTHWLVRMGLTLLLAPPPVDVRVYLKAVIDPLFEPEGDS